MKVINVLSNNANVTRAGCGCVCWNFDLYQSGYVLGRETGGCGSNCGNQGANLRSGDYNIAMRK